MVIGFSIDLLNFARELAKILRKEGKEKIPLGRFIKIIEEKYKTKLSRSCKEEIINELRENGTISVIKSKYGKKYVILGGVSL